MKKSFQEVSILQKSSFDHPNAIILAGQPGSGKGGLAKAAELELSWDVVKIDPDELRDFHPQVKSLRNAHPYTWSGYTHADASQWADELLQATIEGRKNLIFDTTLSNGQWSAELIKDLQSRGYDVEVRAMAAHKLESEHGVDFRFSQQLDQEGYGRYVPEGAREAIYTKLPVSLDTVHAQTTAPIRIFNRQGAEVYDSRTDARPPGQALEQARNAWFKDPAVTQALRESWQQQADWHRALPAHVQDIPNAIPAVQEQVLAEHAELHVSDGVNSRLEGIATIDELVRPGAPPARVPLPEPEIPGVRRAGMTAGLAGLGVAATAYDASQTGERVLARCWHKTTSPLRARKRCTLLPEARAAGREAPPPLPWLAQPAPVPSRWWWPMVICSVPLPTRPPRCGTTARSIRKPTSRACAGSSTATSGCARNTPICQTMAWMHRTSRPCSRCPKKHAS
nr:zeta toxin family protein [Xanthomonas axonopodis]